jgi:hypothetical protein
MIRSPLSQYCPRSEGRGTRLEREGDLVLAQTAVHFRWILVDVAEIRTSGSEIVQWISTRYWPAIVEIIDNYRGEAREIHSIDETRALQANQDREELDLIEISFNIWSCCSSSSPCCCWGQIPLPKEDFGDMNLTTLTWGWSGNGTIVTPTETNSLDHGNELVFVLNLPSPLTNNQTNGDILEIAMMREMVVTLEERRGEGKGLTVEWQICREISWSRFEIVWGFKWGKSVEGRSEAWRWERRRRSWDSGRSRDRGYLSIFLTESPQRERGGAIITRQAKTNILKTNSSWIERKWSGWSEDIGNISRV